MKDKKTIVAGSEVYTVFHLCRCYSDRLLCHFGDLYSGLLDSVSDLPSSVDPLELYPQPPLYLQVCGECSCGNGEGIWLLPWCLHPCLLIWATLQREQV